MEGQARRSGFDAATVALLGSAAALLAVPFGLRLTLPDVAAKILDPQQSAAYVLFVVFSTLILVGIRRARSGADLYIRPIAGLKAVDEAIGRATEMGRKILYVPGILSMEEIQTIASMAVLSHVAKQRPGTAPISTFPTATP